MSALVAAERGERSEWDLRSYEIPQIVRDEFATGGRDDGDRGPGRRWDDAFEMSKSRLQGC